MKNGYRASGHEHLKLDEKTLIVSEESSCDSHRLRICNPQNKYTHSQVAAALYFESKPRREAWSFKLLVLVESKSKISAKMVADTVSL